MNIKALLLCAAFSIPAVASAEDTTKRTDTTQTKPSDTKQAKLSPEAVDVVAHINHVNMMEIDMGKLAQKKGTPKVKQYGAMLIKDHTAANKDLKAMAKKKGLAKIPADKPKTEAMQKEQQDHMTKVAQLRKMSGAEFDREFLTMMIADHEKTLSRVDTAMNTVEDPELEAYLTSLKPALQRHADQARELQTDATTVGAADPKPAPRTTK